MTLYRSLGSRDVALWLLQRLVPDRGLSNAAVAITAPAELRLRPLQEAFRWLISRHELLRSTFPLVDGVPRRLTRSADDIVANLDVFSTIWGPLPDNMRQYCGASFDLDDRPPIRVGVFNLTSEKPTICLVGHHIVMDHKGLRALAGELIEGYFSFAAYNVPPEMSAAALKLPVSDVEDGVMRYWRNRVAGFEPGGMELLGTRTRPEIPTFAGGHLAREIPDGTLETVAALVRRLQVTNDVVLLSAYFLLLLRHGAGPDMMIGVMVDAHRDADDEGGINCRADTVPLRVRVNLRAGFADLVARVGEALDGAMEHPGVSYESLMVGGSDGHTEPTVWRSDVLRHAFGFRGEVISSVGDGLDSMADGFVISYAETGLARFDLELTCEVIRNKYFLHLAFSTEVHDQFQAVSYLDRYLTLLRVAAGEPETPVEELDQRTSKDQALVAKANDTVLRWSGSESVLELVQNRARKTPTAPAIVEDGGHLRYDQLIAAAIATRELLARHGVGQGDVVAVAGPRTARTVAALLGIWAVGAAYLPLDSTHPIGRLMFQLADSGCRWIIDGESLPEGCLDGRRSIDSIDPHQPLSGIAAGNLRVPANALAYVIYTSGSTGRPKGVRLTHGNLHNVVKHFAELLQAGPDDSMLWHTTFSFDMSALELWLPLASGGRAVVAADAIRARPEALFDVMQREHVTIVQATPTTWRLLVPQAGQRLSGLRVLCGGEQMSWPLAAQLLACGCRLFNVYGPTETTIWSTAAELTLNVPDVTIGRPIANTRVHILDEQQRELPIGIPGELCIGGDGVALGYVDMPEQTAASFPDHPDLGRIYRTGDIARWRHDGSLDLFGRKDRQVKLRAHRIELGEVESVLEEHPAVRASAVVLSRSADHEGVLAAYAVVTDPACDSQELWRHVADRLPTYAVPTRITILGSLPETANGKIDYRRLEALEPPQALPESSAVFEETNDPLTDRLIDLWRQALAIPELDANANFFLNGGHSLLAVRLAAQVSEICGEQVDLVAIFRAPTPARLARKIRAQGQKGNPMS